MTEWTRLIHAIAKTPEIVSSFPGERGPVAKHCAVHRHLFEHFWRAREPFKCVRVFLYWPVCVGYQRLCGLLPTQTGFRAALTQRMIHAFGNFPVRTHSYHNLYFHIGMKRNLWYFVLAAGWFIVWPSCIGSQPLTFRAPLIPQIPPEVHHQVQPAESSVSPLPVVHAGSGSRICLPGAVPTVGGLGRGYHDSEHTVHFIN